METPNDPNEHLDRAKETLAAGLFGATLQHLIDALRAAWGPAIAPVDNAAIDAAQAAAIAAPIIERAPLTPDEIAALAPPRPDRPAAPEAPPETEDPGAPKCAQCYRVADAAIHVDRNDANRHDFIPPAIPEPVV